MGHLLALLVGPDWLIWFLAANCIVACLLLSRLPAGLVLCWLCGLLWGGWTVSQGLQARLQVAVHDTALTVVIEALEHHSSMRRAYASVLSGEGEAGRVRRVRLDIYQPLELQVGETWQFDVRLRAPRGRANPGGWDMERHLLRLGVDATGYVRRSADNARLQAAASTRGTSWPETLRSVLSGRLQTEISDPAGRRLLRGLLLGERDALEAHDWEVMRRTGTTHLLIVSGLHVGLVAGLVWFGLAGVGCCARWPRLAALLVIGAAGGYALLTGFDLPARRALIMLAVAYFCVAWGRRTAPVTALALAAALILVFDPMAPLATGFWLSFIVVAGLLCLLGGRPRQADSRLWLAARTQLVAAWVLMAPLTGFFGQLPLLSPIINLLAVPAVALVLLPAGLLGLLATLLAVPGAAAGLDGLGWLLGTGFRQLARVPELHMRMLAVSYVALAGIVLLALITTAPLPWRLRLPALCVLAGLLMPRPTQVPAGEVEVTVLDVGQGHAAIVRTQGHALVFDAGPNPSASAVLGTLDYLGVGHLDRILISHAHADHARGLKALRTRYPDARVFSATAMAGSHEACHAGQHWNWDGVEFSVLAPPVGRAGSSRRWLNRHSCVLAVRTESARVLLPGDVDHFVERRLAARLQHKTLLVAAHHGSRTSSAPVLVERTRPGFVVVPAGHSSPFGHPHASVVQRWQSAGADVLVAGESGAVTWRSELPDRLRCERDRRRRYWHWQPAGRDSGALGGRGPGDCARWTRVHEPGRNQ